jgi:Zn-dependent protease with chaperone function
VDFFTRQEHSRRTSRVLVLLFLASFLICATATTIVVAIGLRLYTENNALLLGTERWQDWTAAHFGLLALIAAGTIAVMCLASLSRAASLARGGGQVARMLGATEISGEGSDPLQRRLLNVVEEMALASGVPVPEVYVLEQEPGINAFAAGLTHTNAAITVTRGALERLTRAELQGVIAHEFSHILNGDMRLNQQLIGLSFGILVLALVGRWLLRSTRFAGRSRNSGGVAAAVAIGLALTIIGAIGVVLSRLIKAAVSRQREALADASGVQFTRDPSGLAGALKKIAGFTSQITSAETEEVAHMLFGRAGPSFAGWFATHPPLIERIKALDPSFDPRDLPPAGTVVPETEVAAIDAGAGVQALAGGAPTAAALLGRVGHIETPEVGTTLRTALPEEIYHAAHGRDSSLLLVLALALSSTDVTREHQLRLIENQLGAARASQCRRLFEDLRTLGPQMRLSILELALPALRQRPVEQLTYLFDVVSRVTELEDVPELFDYMLLRVLEAYLRNVPGAPVMARGDDKSELSIRAAVTELIANVAAFGHETAADARAAFTAGMTIVGSPAATPPSFEPVGTARNLAELDRALHRLMSLRPRDKLRILSAVLATIRRDGTIEVEEAELFRAIAATLDCPLPPSGYGTIGARGTAPAIR